MKMELSIFIKKLILDHASYVNCKTCSFSDSCDIERHGSVECSDFLIEQYKAGMTSLIKEMEG